LDMTLHRSCLQFPKVQPINLDSGLEMNAFSLINIQWKLSVIAHHFRKFLSEAPIILP
jgi:hypothetical protein